MYNEYDPVEGNWYHRVDTDNQFQVLAVYEDDAIIEVQYFDGNVGEFDTDTWRELDIELMETPIDWSGPMDPADAATYGGGGETPDESEAVSAFDDDVSSSAGSQGGGGNP